MSEPTGPDARLQAACTARIDRLRSSMAGAGVDAVLVSHDIDIRYLTGFIGHDSLLVVFADGAAIVSDSRYEEFLDPWQACGLLDVVMGIRHRLHVRTKALCDAHGVQRLGLQGEHVTLAARDRLAETLGVRLVSTTGLVGKLRLRKDDLEIETIERACRCHQAALDAALPQVRVGMSERDFSAVLEYEMKTRGAEGASFDPIIATGANASVIHYMTGQTPIEPGVLLVDWGAIVDGYCSDMTRTFGVGELPAPLREAYSIVLEAQLAAIEACAPGKTCASIDAVARKVITDAGHGEHFGHGLGHGLGMEVHEDPYFNDLSTDVELEPGMVMTVEPGIYLPGIGGVRIEDDVLITDGGCRVLSDWPKGLDGAELDSNRHGASVTAETTR